MKILIVTKNWLGDILFEEPAIRMVRERYPEAELVCLCPPRCREILEKNPNVTRVIPFDERAAQRSFRAKFKFVLELRKAKFDKVYLFHRSKTRAFLFWAGGVRERIGYRTKSAWFLTKAVPEPEKALHHVDYFINLLVQDGFSKPADPSYQFYFSTEDRGKALRILQQNEISEPFVCFHLGANWEPKRWPAEHFAKLATLISAKSKMNIVLTGGRQDQGLARQMISLALNSHPVDLTGRTSLGELAAIFSRASFVVSGDSGPMHIASGAGTRVAAIFGPTNPDLTGPRGTGEKMVLTHVPQGYQSPWYGKDGEKLPPEGWLSQITPEQVFEALEEKGWFQKKLRHADVPLFSRPKRDEKKGHILIVTLSNIGDVILTTPVITFLARQYPKSSVTVVCGPKAAPLLEKSHWVDRLIVYDKHASLLKKLKFLKQLRENKYDCVVDLRNSAIPFLVSARRRSPIFRKFSMLQMRDRHLQVLRQMGFQPDGESEFDFFHEDDVRKVLSKLNYKGAVSRRNWILAAPVAASSAKTWKEEGFQRVIEKLLESHEQDILLVGDGSARQVCQRLSAIDRKRVFDLAGETSLRELGVLVHLSAMLLTNDSAIMHMAYEMNRPVVALFGPTNHEKYGRTGPFWNIVRQDLECSPCEKKNCLHDHKALFQELEPEKVYQACLEVLGAATVKIHD